jgi:hypothetical protein
VTRSNYMAERINFTPDDQANRKFRRLNRTNIAVGATALVFGLGSTAIGALKLEHTISGAAASEYVKKNPNATPDQIGSQSAGLAAHGALDAAIGLTGVGLGVGALELTRLARRSNRQSR